MPEVEPGRPFLRSFRRSGTRPRTLLLGAFLLLLAQGAASAPREGGGARPEEIVAHLQRKYEATRTLSADFEQENTLLSLGRTTRAKGSLLLSKPGRIRMEYTQPESQLIVSDGSRLWVYTARLKQAIVSEVEGAASTPLLFLAGKGDLRQSFRVEVEEVGAPRRAEGVWKAGHPHRLSLQPLEPNAGFRQMWLEVEPESFLITGLEYADALGNKSRLRFSNIREGAAVGADAFRFEVPPGVDVVRVPGQGRRSR